MAFFVWLSRCIPGLSILVLLVFIEFTLGTLQSAWFAFHGTSQVQTSKNPILLWMFVAYSLFLHFMTFCFPIRLCRAVWTATTKIEETHREQDDDSTRVNTPEDEVSVKSLELSDLDGLISECTPAIMAIIIPSYKEDISVMEDTLNVLASHPQARDTYDIYLAMEERDPNASHVAQRLVKSFEDRFSRMKYTVHPANISGEAPGKSSNVSWAAKEVERLYKGSAEWKNVLITTMDSDTHLLPQYFQYLRNAHHRNQRAGRLTDMTLYMPPIVFDRNAHLVPTMVRVADLMWCGAGLALFLPEPTMSGIAIPTSVYSIPLALAHLVNGWDTDPGAIGEDMHMMLKCYFATNGKMKIESIPSPASQCNISTELRGFRGWLSNHGARYNQGLRHMWGCLDFGFAVRQWCSLNKPSSRNNSPTSGPCNGLASLQQRSRRKLSHTELSLKLSQYALHGSEGRRFTWRNLTVFLRLYEAHFLPAHLVIILITSTVFTSSIKSSMELSWISFCLDLTAYMRQISYVTMVLYFFIVYERYHNVCLQAREREMSKAGLHGQMTEQFSRRGRWNMAYWPDYFIFPVPGMLFGSCCLFQAALSHFRTERIIYLVSAKPVRNPSSPSTTTDGRPLQKHNLV